MLSDAELAALTPDERRAYGEYMHRDESRYRDVETIASLVRVLKELAGDLAHLPTNSSNSFVKF